MFHLALTNPTTCSTLIVKHLKTFTGLAEIAKGKGLGENPEMAIVISCSFVIPKYKKLFLFCRNLYNVKTRINSKYQSKG